MPTSIRRCSTCKLLFPTIEALDDHQKLTFHTPLKFICESCKRAFETLSSLQSHNKSKHHLDSKVDGKSPVSAAIAQMDGSVQRSVRNDWSAEHVATDWSLCDIWSTPPDVSGWNISVYKAQSDDRDPTLTKKRPSTALSNISTFSEPTLPSPSSPWGWHAKVLPSETTPPFARVILPSSPQAEAKSDEAALLFSDSDIWRPKKKAKLEPSVSKLDGSRCITPDLSSNSTSKSKLPLNSPDNTIRPFACPGCRKDFMLFSGFVLHIENRSCKSSMCHEIEDQVNTCATQFFATFTRDEI